MKCKRKGCAHMLRPEQVAAGIEHHSQQCAQLDRRGTPLVLVPKVPDKDYQMRCYVCKEWFDGRDGPMIGVCSTYCVGRNAIEQASAERERRGQRAAVG